MNQSKDRNNLNIVIADNSQDLLYIQQLAEIIWPIAYRGVIAKEQIRFMLDHLYSIEKLKRAIEKKQMFYICYLDDLPSGFMSLYIGEEKLRVEKLYVLPNKQGQGLGKSMLSFANKLANELFLPILELNVNRNNTALHFYKKMGFVIYKEIDIPFHQYVLNDYIMRKKV